MYELNTTRPFDVASTPSFTLLHGALKFPQLARPPGCTTRHIAALLCLLAREQEDALARTADLPPMRMPGAAALRGKWALRCIDQGRQAPRGTVMKQVAGATRDCLGVPFSCCRLSGIDCVVWTVLAVERYLLFLAKSWVSLLLPLLPLLLLELRLLPRPPCRPSPSPQSYSMRS